MQCSTCSPYNEQIWKEELVSCVKTFFSRGMVSVGGGNHSFRSDDARGIWITPSGYPRSHLVPDDLIMIDLNGNIILGNLRPSIEVPFHTEIYKAKPKLNAACHTHNPYTQGFFLSARLKHLRDGISTLSESPLINFPRILGDFPLVIQYQQLGSRSLGNVVAIVCRDYLPYSCGIIILLNHGVIGIGKCIHEAKFAVDLIEEWARCLAIASRLPTF
jgi:ribulose-5-phosphate 4-epimerase/fuculose-1-phosphate aldolase